VVIKTNRSDKTEIKKILKISGHQQSWGYEDGPWKGPGPALLMAADFFTPFLFRKFGFRCQERLAQ
jgi:hypothetical protein